MCVKGKRKKRVKNNSKGVGKGGTAGKEFDLHSANPCLMPSIPYSPPALPVEISQYTECVSKHLPK